MADDIARAQVRIVPDLTGFREELSAAIQAAVSGAGGNVKVEADTSQLDEAEARVAAFGSGTTTKRVNVDTGDSTAKLAALDAQAQKGGGGLSLLAKVAIGTGSALAPLVQEAAAVGVGLAGIGVGGIAGFEAFKLAAGQVIPWFDAAAKNITHSWQQAMGPIVTPVFQNALAALPTVFARLTPVVEGAAHGLATMVQYLDRFLQSQGVIEFFQELGQVSMAVFSSLGPIIAQVAAGLMHAFLAAEPLIFDVLQLIGKLANQFAGVDWGAIITPLVGDFERLTPIVTQFIGSIGHLVSTLGGALAPIGSALFQAISGTITAVLPLMRSLSQVIQAIAPVVGRVAAAFAQLLGGALRALVPVVQAFLPIIQQVVTVIGSALVNSMHTVGPLITGLAKPLTALAQGFLQAFGPVLQQVIQAFTDALTPLTFAFEPLAKALGSSAPLFRTIGQAIGQLAGPVLELVAKVTTLGATLLAELMPAITTVASALLRALVPVLKDLAPIIAQVASVLGKALAEAVKAITPAIKELAPVFSDIGRVLAGVLPVLGRLVDSILRSLVPVIRQLGPIIKELVPIIGNLLVQSLTTLAPLFRQLAPVIGQLVQMVAELLVPVLRLVAPLIRLLAPLIEAMSLPMAIQARLISAVLTPALRLLMPVLETLTRWLGDVANAVTWLTGHWTEAWAHIKSAFTPVVNAIKATWDAVWGAMKAVFDAVWGAIFGAARAVWGAFSSFFRGIFDALSNWWFHDVWGRIYSDAMAVWNALSAAGRAIFGAFSAALQAVWSVIEPYWNALWSAVRTVALPIWNALYATGSAIFGTLRDVLSAIWNAVSSTFSTVWNTISGIASSIWGAISGTANTVFGGISSFISTTWGFIEGVFSSAYGIISGAWNGFWNGLIGVVSSVWGTIRSIVVSGVNDVIAFLNPLISAFDTATGWVPGVPHIPTITPIGQGSAAPATSQALQPNRFGAGIQPRASGGPVTAGQPYLVGESGPEPFIPNQSGTILPNSALTSGALWDPNASNSALAAARQHSATMVNLLLQMWVQSLNNTRTYGQNIVQAHQQTWAQVQGQSLGAWQLLYNQLTATNNQALANTRTYGTTTVSTLNQAWQQVRSQSLDVWNASLSDLISHNQQSQANTQAYGQQTQDTLRTTWQNVMSSSDGIWSQLQSSLAGHNAGMLSDTSNTVTQAHDHTVSAYQDMANQVPGLVSSMWTNIGSNYRTGIDATITQLDAFLKGVNTVGGQVGWSVNLNVPMLSSGGRFDSPTAIVGEGGAPEYVLPTDPKHRSNAMSLLGGFLKETGIRAMADGGVIGDPTWTAMANSSTLAGLPPAVANALAPHVLSSLDAHRSTFAASAANFGAAFGGGGGAISGAQVAAYWIAAGGLPSAAEVMAAISYSESGDQPRIVQQGQPYACVPLDTDILTKRGWLHHDEVRVGDETLAYNPKTGRNEWTQVREVVHYDDAPVWEIGNKRFRARVTPNHRWWSDTEVDGKTRGEFVETHHLGSHHRIRLAAQADTDGIPGLMLEECALVGWLMGDGHVYRAQRSPNWEARIYQSKPEQVARLRSLLARIPHTERVRERGANRLPAHEFRLHRQHVNEVLKRAHWDEWSPEEFVLALSPEQRSSWLAAMIDAEGDKVQGYEPHHKPYVRISQNVGPLLEAIKLAVYLEGYRPTIADVGGTSQFKASAPCRRVGMARPHITAGRSHCVRELPRQSVWCVSTDLGTWTARQDGLCFTTGNTTGWGLFQITPGNSVPSVGIDGALLDPLVNARAAVAKFNAAGGLSPWTGDPAVNALGGVAAANHAIGLYDKGGWLPTGASIAVNQTGRPERVLGPGEGGGTVIHFEQHNHGVSGGDANAIARATRRQIEEALDERDAQLVTAGYSEGMR